MRSNRHISRMIAVLFLAIALAVPQVAMAHEGGFLPYMNKNLFETETVTISGLRAEYKGEAKAGIEFAFFNTATQEDEFRVISGKDGILPDVKVKKNHNYMILSQDEKFFVQKYVWVSNYNDDSNGKYALLDVKKCNGAKEDINGNPCTYDIVDSFNLVERKTYQDKANRYTCRIPVAVEGSDNKYLGEVKFRLVSDFETIECTTKSGEIREDLLEDIQYMVICEDPKFDVELFPLTVKDHSERGEFRNTYDHSSCGGVGTFYTISSPNTPDPRYFLKLLKKGENHKNDTTIVSDTQKSSASGMNFKHLYLREKKLDRTVETLSESKYDVVSILAINPHREEISKLCAGDFTLTENLGSGKKVTAVYELKEDGSLSDPLEFTQEKTVVTFKTHQISVRPYVFEYEVTEEPGGGETPAPEPGGGGGGSTPAPGGGSGSGGGGAVPGVPATPSKNPVTNMKDDNGNVSTDVDLSDKVNAVDGKADVMVDKNLADKVVENAVANKSDSVTINATTSVGDAAKTEFTLPADTYKDIAGKTDVQKVTVKTDNGSVSMDRDAVIAVVEHAGSAEEVKLVVETKETAEDKVVVELKLVTSNGEIHDFKGGKVTVTVPVKNTSGKKLVAVYIDDNGKYTKMGGELTDAGFVFETGHFSQYAVMTEEAADAAIKAQEPEKPAKPAIKSVALTSVKAQKKAMKVTWKKSADKVSGYQVRYSTSKSFKTCKTVSVKYTKKVNSRTVKSLKSSKRYYVKVRTYVKNDDGTYYSKWSKVKSVKVK